MTETPHETPAPIEPADEVDEVDDEVDDQADDAAPTPHEASKGYGVTGKFSTTNRNDL